MDIVPFLRNIVGQQLLHGAKRRRERSRELAATTERMEPRLMLFAATGNEWPAPQVVTISFEPDGTNLGGVTSNLNAKFNGSSALNGKWQTEILRAAQSWASATNINLVVVNDSGVASGTGSYQQGDPTQGDIRIGGYNFGNTALARAFAPPPVNNYSLAGDIAFNTAISFGIGSGYDLFTVAAHEFGHAFGLGHTSASNKAEMWSSYDGVKPTLAADDIAGIRNVYSGNAARSLDRYAGGATPNFSFSAAANISSSINASTKTAVMTGLDHTTATETEFFKFTAPAGSSSSATVGVQSTGLSLLSPLMTVYAADQKTVLSTASGLNQHGATLNVHLTGVKAGTTYYVKVQGADSSVFSVGQYALTLNLGTGAAPTVPLSHTSKPNGTPLSSGGGMADSGGILDDLLPGIPAITAVTNLVASTSLGNAINSSAIGLAGAAPEGYTVKIYQDVLALGGLSLLRLPLGSAVANAHNQWSFAIPGSLTSGVFAYSADGVDTSGGATGRSSEFVVTVIVDKLLQPVVTGLSLGSILGGGGPNVSNPSLLAASVLSSSLTGVVTAVATPTFTGSGIAGNTVNVYDGNKLLGSAIVGSNGKWTFVSPNLGKGSHVVFTVVSDPQGRSSLASKGLTFSV